MTLDLALVLGLLLAAIVMFALDRPRMDVVALLMILALPLTGVLTIHEALVGFADPNVVLIALLFVVGEGLVRTGVAGRLGDLIAARAGASETRLVTLLMAVVIILGSVMSSTGVVALFIPIVLRVAQQTDLAPGRLLMPLSVAALVSGMMTLVGTPPNLVVHSELVRDGLPGFSFFSFTPLGLPIAVLAIGYMLVARRWLRAKPAGPARAAHRHARPGFTKWIEEYALADRAFLLRVEPGSPLAGRTLADADLRASRGVNVVAIERPARFGRTLLRPTPRTELHVGDRLFFDIDVGRPEGFDLHAFCAANGLSRQPLVGPFLGDVSQEIGLAEVLVPENSALVDQTVVSAAFRSTYGLTVLGLRRGRHTETHRIGDARLAVGDTLLVVGPWQSIQHLQAASASSSARDVIVLHLPAEFDRVVPAGSRAPLAAFALGAMVVLMVTGWVSNVQAALVACLLMGLFGCIDMSSAYRSIHWPSLILIVGMLPFSLALQKTGAVDLASGALVNALGDGSPRLMLAGLFAATMLLGLFVSNTATAVLMAPVAIAVAKGLDASPYPFAMTVALAASTAFMTPISSPVNTLVLGPGNYTFFDFVRIGVPLAILTMILAVTMVPWLLPF